MARQSRDTARIQLEISDYLEAEGADIHNVRLFLNSKTLRLTKYGYSILHKHMGSWTIDIDTTLVTQDMIQLFREIDTPYYIRVSGKQIVLFSEEDAFMAKLAGVKGWIESK